MPYPPGYYPPPSLGITNAPGSTQPVIPPVGGGSSGILGDIGGWLVDHWQDLAKLGLGALTTKEALQNSSQSNALTTKALDMAGQDYAGRQPFRDAATAKLLNPARPNLAPIFANPGNPYTSINRSIPVVGGNVGANMTTPTGQPVDPTKTASQLWRTPPAPPAYTPGTIPKKGFFRTVGGGTPA